MPKITTIGLALAKSVFQFIVPLRTAIRLFAGSCGAAKWLSFSPDKNLVLLPWKRVPVTASMIDAMCAS